MKNNVLSIMLLLWCLKLYPQAESIQRVNIKSPEVTAFDKIGKVPVSLYTGVPQISVPIYEIKCGDIKFPITLDYQATAVQVNQESTWVGLNWLLNAGGVITTRTTKPTDGVLKKDWNFLYNSLGLQSVNNDDLGQAYKMDGCHEIGWRGKYGFNRFQNILYPYPMDLSYSLYSHILDNYEGEAQSYSANFMGYSFEFVYHPLLDKFVVIGKDQKFKIVGSPTSVTKIIDSGGIQYTFGEVEVNAPEAYTNVPYVKRSTSFYLTEIMYPNGRIINLRYKKYDAIRLLPEVQEIWYFNYPNKLNYNIEKNLSDFVSINNYYLSEISADDVTISFNVGARTDIKGGRKLENIEIKNKLNKLIKRFCFMYDYFGGNDVGGNRLYDYYKEHNQLTSYNSIYSSDEINKRLRLISLHEEVEDSSGNIEMKPPYRFFYNSELLPSKASSARDYWGYYNGKFNQTLLVNRSKSGESLYNNFPYSFSMHCADRRCNPNTIDVGLLSDIIYPTGGQAHFNYEPHSFTNYTYLDVNQTSIQSSLSIYAMTSNTNSTIPAANTEPKNFTVERDIEVEITVSWSNPKAYPWIEMLGSPAFLFIYKTVTTSNGAVEVSYPYKTWALNPPDTLKANDGCVTHVERLLLPAGRCQLRPTISSPQLSPPYTDFYGAKRVEMSVKSTNVITSYGGGIRIKQIQQISGDGKTISTNYDYSTEEGASSGLLMYPLHFTRKKMQVYQIEVQEDQSEPAYAQLKEYWVCSVANMSLSKGIPVGYSRVSVVNSNSGKIVNEFWNKKNSSNFSFDYCPPLNDPRNGNLLKETYYDSSNHIQREVTNIYSVLHKEHHFINAIVDDIYYGPLLAPGGRVNIYATLCNGGRMLFCIYPSSKFWIERTKQIVNEYTKNGMINTEFEYSYNPWNLSLSTVKTTYNAGMNEMKYVLYPQNYVTSAAYPYTLINKHILNVPIEVLKVVNHAGLSSVISGDLNVYDDNGQLESHSKLRLPQSLDINDFKFSNKAKGQVGTDTLNSTGYSPSSDYFIEESLGYSPSGNPSYITDKQNLTSVYLWSYNKKYIIAKITNSTYEEVKKALGYTYNSQITSLENESYPDVFGMRSKLDCYFKGLPVSITTYTYQPLIGMTSMTAPNGEVTTYEYDSFGRLVNVKNHDGKATDHYEYHY